MGIIGIAMSLLFRMQLAWPEQPMGIMSALLGKMGSRWGNGSKCVFSIGNYSWNYYGFLCP